LLQLQRHLMLLQRLLLQRGTAAPRAAAVAASLDLQVLQRLLYRRAAASAAESRSCVCLMHCHLVGHLRFFLLVPLVVYCLMLYPAAAMTSTLIKSSRRADYSCSCSSSSSNSNRAYSCSWPASAAACQVVAGCCLGLQVWRSSPPCS
jgi:hypothetical protein